jgi:hypothetical protein
VKEVNMNGSEAPASQKRSALPGGSFVTATALSAFALGGVVGFLGPEHLTRFADSAPALWLGAATVMVAFSLVAGTIWMRSIDELAQRAHYVAWFWGGSLGMAALMLLVLAAPVLAQFVDFAALTRWLSPITGEAAGFTAGVFASLMIMVLGYGLWWLVFWLRKR